MQSAIAVHAGSVFAAIERLSKGLAGGSARKSIVLLSEGFVRDPEDRREPVAIDAARRANTAVYFVDARGLVALTTPFQAATAGPAPAAGDVGAMILEDTILAIGGTESLAEETGGTVSTGNNDLVAGLDRAAEESTTYYLLGYQPTRPPSTKWRKLEVRVGRPGLKVRSRQGYYPTLPSEPVKKAKSDKSQNREEAKDKGLDPTLLASGDRADIPLRMVPYVFDSPAKGLARVIAVLDVDASVLAAAGRSKVELDLILMGVSRSDGQVYRFQDRLEATVRSGATQSWWTFSRELRLPAGVSQVRALVRELGTSRAGSVTERIEVPKLDAPHLSTPILSDRLEPTPDGRQSPVLLAHRAFAPQGRLYCQYEVFGVAGAAVEAGYSLRRADGSVVREAAPTPIARSANGRLVRMLGLSLDGLEAGAYTLSVTVHPAGAGAPMSSEEPFVVEPKSVASAVE
jgi:hypothetical protein